MAKLFFGARYFYVGTALRFSCILLGYPVALDPRQPARRTANLLMILVAGCRSGHRFWCGTSAWKVMLQQQRVVHYDTLASGWAIVANDTVWR